MAHFAHTVAVPAPADALWGLVRDVVRVAGLFGYVDLDDVTRPEPGVTALWRTLRLPGLAPLRWRERNVEAPGPEVRFRAEEGDLPRFEGAWRVTADGPSAHLAFEVDYELPADGTVPLPAPVAHFVMAELFRAVCARIAEAAAGDAP